MIHALLLLWAAMAEPMTGTWKVTGEISGNPVTPVCQVVQTGAALSGQCTSQEKPVKLTGEVKDSQVTWTYSVDYEGQTFTLVYTGKLQVSGQMEGSIEVREAGASGTFTAKKE